MLIKMSPHQSHVGPKACSSVHDQVGGGGGVGEENKYTLPTPSAVMTCCDTQIVNVPLLKADSEVCNLPGAD
jgi:hypothetical protein